MWSIKANFISCGLNILNIFVLLSGLLLSIVGLLFKTSHKYEHAFISDQINGLVVTILIIGIVLVILGLTGGIALNTTIGNPMVVASYILGLMLVTFWLALFSRSTYLSFIENKYTDQAKESMNATFNLFVEKYSEVIETKEINLLQKKFKCCGLDSYTDWKKKNNDPDFHSAILKYKLLITADQIAFDLPDTCCKNYTENCGKDFRHRDTINLDGCYEPFLEYLDFRILIVCNLSIGVTVIHLLSLIFWFVVSVMLKGDYSVVNPSMKEKIYESVATSKPILADEKPKSKKHRKKHNIRQTKVSKEVVVIEFADSDSI